MRSQYSLGRRALAEAVGTFLLVLVGPGAVMVNGATHGAVTNPGIALAFAFVVTAVILAFGHLSGAHIDPAVTIAFVTVRRFPAKEAPIYVAAQCTGAIGASAILGSILGPVGNFGATTPAYGFGIGAGAAFLLEWLMPFVLAFSDDRRCTDVHVAARLCSRAGARRRDGIGRTDRRLAAVTRQLGVLSKPRAPGSSRNCTHLGRRAPGG